MWFWSDEQRIFSYFEKFKVMYNLVEDIWIIAIAPTLPSHHLKHWSHHLNNRRQDCTCPSRCRQFAMLKSNKVCIPRNDCLRGLLCHVTWYHLSSKSAASWLLQTLHYHVYNNDISPNGVLYKVLSTKPFYQIMRMLNHIMSNIASKRKCTWIQMNHQVTFHRSDIHLVWSTC